MSAVSSVLPITPSVSVFETMRVQVREFVARHSFTADERTARLVGCTPVAVLGAVNHRR
ncbi:hypothetical protein [Nocardia sp. NBC_01327]|uniref:hypothetical protein n=1 Tax=Nocardia sp. NBC_01327 TaxID=2903593 RepID=UPI002E1538F3|nr:hypothetical protein OG326_33840 [Nocardia sp. NBC_01327]